MNTAPTLSAVTADVASALLRLLRTAPGGPDEKSARHRLLTALVTCRFDNAPNAVNALVEQALAAGWDRHPQRAPLRSLAPAAVVTASAAKPKGRRWGFLR
jgi:hypothetical protein